jgi:hypothetical protein
MATRVGEVGSLVIDVAGSQLDAFMVDRFGVVRDRFRIVKGATPVPVGGSVYRTTLLLGIFAITGGLCLFARRGRDRRTTRT